MIDTSETPLVTAGDCVSTESDVTQTSFMFTHASTPGTEMAGTNGTLWGVFTLLTFTTTIFGNAVLVYIITSTSALRTITNAMVASMAVADFLIGCLVMPFSVVSFLFNGWIFGYEYCHIVGFCYSTCSVARILNITIVSVDRWVAVTWPLKYSVFITPPVAGAMIVYVWVHSCIFAVFPLFGWGSYFYRHYSGVCSLDWTSNRHYLISKYVCCWIVPVSLTLVVFLGIVRAANNQRRVFTAMPVAVGVVLAITPNPQVNYRRSTIYAMKTLFLIVFVTVVMHLPRLLTEAVAYYRRDTGLAISPYTYGAVSWLALSSSAVNPIIFLMNSKFKNRFRETFCRCIKVKPNSDSSVVDVALPQNTLTTGADTPVVPRRPILLRGESNAFARPLPTINDPSETHDKPSTSGTVQQSKTITQNVKSNTLRKIT